MKATKICIKNPSDYERSGYAEVLWQSLDLDPQLLLTDFTLKNSWGNTVPHQIHHVLPQDRERTTLSVLLPETIPPYGESVLEVVAGASGINTASGSVSIPESAGRPTGIMLKNERMQIHYYLNPTASTADPWYGGSATSVVLDDYELLDQFAASYGWRGHDPEKRCMQIDRVRLNNPPWADTSYQEFDLSESTYHILSTTTGPVKNAFTIASEPFSYAFSLLPDESAHAFSCRLYRTVSLPKDADYLLEDLFVLPDPLPEKSPQNLFFAARFFSLIDMGFLPRVYQFQDVDWFAIASPWAPYAAYGFATDSQSGRVLNPHPEYGNPSKAHRTFSWEILKGNTTRVLHLFMRGDVSTVDHQTGVKWYEQIYEPLRISSK